MSELTAELTPESHSLLWMEKEQHGGGAAPSKREDTELVCLGSKKNVANCMEMHEAKHTALPNHFYDKLSCT